MVHAGLVCRGLYGACRGALFLPVLSYPIGMGARGLCEWGHVWGNDATDQRNMRSSTLQMTECKSRFANMVGIAAPYCATQKNSSYSTHTYTLHIQLWHPVEQQLFDAQTYTRNIYSCTHIRTHSHTHTHTRDACLHSAECTKMKCRCISSLRLTLTPSSNVGMYFK